MLKPLHLFLMFLLILAFLAPLGAQEGISAQDNYLYAKRLFDEGYFDLAAEQLERVLADAPGMPDADEAQYLLGESHLRAGNFKAARAAFLRVAIVSPESPRAPESLFKVGSALDSLDQKPEAAQSYERVDKFYPESPFAVRGLSRALSLNLSITDSANADRIADILIQKHPRATDADAARLYLADRYFQRGEIADAKLFLQRIAERAATDSLTAQALAKLGTVQKSNWELEAAAQSYRAALKRDSISDFSGLTRLKLATLQNQRRLTDEALSVLKPILSNPDHPYYQEALLRAGDACFLNNDLTEAFNYYQKSTHPEARIKAAWTAERAGSPQMALKIYLILTAEDNPSAEVATIRAAQLSARLKLTRQATDLWLTALERGASTDKTGRYYYEAMRSLSADSSEQIQSYLNDIRNKIRRISPISPYLDDVDYLYIQWCERREQYQQAAGAAEQFIRDYPCSPFLDSARYGLDFIRRCRLRSQDLVERMAELSSRPQNSVKPTKWAADWGDFYLYNFKDPVKAIDQYDRILDDVSATTEERVPAFKGSVDAYIRLYEIALREKDDVSSSIYSDSSRARLRRFEKITDHSDAAMQLRCRFTALNILAASSNAQPLASALTDAREALDAYREDRLPPEWIAQYLLASLKSDHFQATSWEDWSKIAATAFERAETDRVKARIKLFEARALLRNARANAARDSVFAILTHWGQTCADAEATRLLASETLLPPADRLQRFKEFQHHYPYLVQPEAALRLEAELLDLIGQPIEALDRLEKADQIAAWGKPALDFQSPISPESRLRRARAFLTADSLNRAEVEFRGLYNSDPKGTYGALSLINLAEINNRRKDYQTALALLDTLETRFPYEKNNLLAAHLRPRVEFQLERYAAAEKGFQTLLDAKINEDSSFCFATMVTVCQYRQNKLDRARDYGKELLKTFKDRKDLDEAKARFTFERGLAEDRQKNFDEARKQYETVMKSFSTTAWADDAALENGLSYIKQNQFETGIPQLSRFLENYPSSELVPEARLNLALAYIKLEKYTEAVAAARAAWNDAACQRVWIPAFQTLLTTYKTLGFTDAAISLNREYLRRFPSAADAIDRRMDIAQTFLSNGDWDDALRQYRPLLPFADAEREAEIQYYIGEATQSKGDYRGAILEYLKVPILGRKTKLDWGVTAQYQAGVCYEKLGDKAGARRMYQKIIQQTGEASNYGRAAQTKLNELDTKK